MAYTGKCYLSAGSVFIVQTSSFCRFGAAAVLNIYQLLSDDVFLAAVSDAWPVFLLPLQGFPANPSFHGQCNLANVVYHLCSTHITEEQKL